MPTTGNGERESKESEKIRNLAGGKNVCKVWRFSHFLVFLFLSEILSFLLLLLNAAIIALLHRLHHLTCNNVPRFSSAKTN